MWRKLALAAAVMPIVACASGGTSSQPSVAAAPAVATQTGVSNVFGTAASEYTLQAVDGHTLPYAKAASDAALAPTVIVGGSLVLQPNGAFSMATTYRESQPAGERTFDGKASGACAPEGDGYRMFWEGGGDTQLTVRGDTALVNNAGIVFTYLKRR